ncbi:uncharacterized protein LOC141680867 [Apium graveolens]|uniref:uncharacterized protein LOC141680867 n=1 Tax=Apium graveolens TaxID=4045 RepID=UPI003D7AC017
MGANPSFIWRSLTEAQPLVLAGVRRCVGSGTTINILNDPWLPDSTNPFVSSTHPGVLEEAAMIGWAIWRACNDLVWNQKNSTAASIVFSARITLDQYRYAQARKGISLSLHLDGGKEREHWTAPVNNQIKVNVDGAIFEWKACNVQPEIAEINGIKEALSWIDRHSWPPVVLETDSLVCVQAINSNMFMPSQFGLLVQDCQESLFSKRNITLRYVKRSANKAAHCIARDSCFYLGGVLQVEDCSAEVISIVVADTSLQ